MPQLFDQARFARLVKEGAKKHTIRTMRRRPFRAGDDLYHYVEMGPHSREHLMDNKCTKVQEIWIHAKGAVMVDGKALQPAEVEELAKRDGFKTMEEFLQYFVPPEREVFKGQLIWWI